MTAEPIPKQVNSLAFFFLARSHAPSGITIARMRTRGNPPFPPSPAELLEEMAGMAGFLRDRDSGAKRYGFVLWCRRISGGGSATVDR
jgi:hypothetical protein